MTTSFSQKIRQDLWNRTQGCCSNPSCDIVTLGPTSAEEGSFKGGEAAHIHSFEQNGPRYCGLSFEAAQDISNGIWLCKICHGKVDQKNNEKFYPADLLLRWKLQAELRASQRVGRPLQAAFYDLEKERSKIKSFLEEMGKISDEFFHTELRSGLCLTRNGSMLIRRGSRGFDWGWNADNKFRCIEEATFLMQNRVVIALQDLSQHINMKYWYCFTDDPIGLERFTPKHSTLSNEDKEYAETLKLLLQSYFQVADELRNFVNRGH